MGAASELVDFFQPTTQPTRIYVLYDFGVVWQSREGVFAEKKENNKWNSKELLGTGTQILSPSPSPLLLLGDARTLLRKRKLSPKNCASL
jgi:hypothetical protein